MRTSTVAPTTKLPPSANGPPAHALSTACTDQKQVPGGSSGIVSPAPDEPVSFPGHEFVEIQDYLAQGEGGGFGRGPGKFRVSRWASQPDLLGVELLEPVEFRPRRLSRQALLKGAGDALARLFPRPFQHALAQTLRAFDEEAVIQQREGLQRGGRAFATSAALRGVGLVEGQRGRKSVV